MLKSPLSSATTAAVDFIKPVVTNLLDQSRFKQRLPADEGQNNSFGVLVDEVAVSVWVLEHVKNQVANILCGVEVHVLLSLVMLIAVRAAEVAAAGYLKSDLSAGRHILRIAPAVKALDHVPIVLKAFTRKH